ncbi:hypothetical protein Vadar_005943 [Vaccinium darrowii]|uniref:Uncharacterized protein n=1 Tax=Vaccinium darrowii TaxID=229202 RepID=A0ACB7YCI0_9ERIC|nr:hypothetical protein Vadar_005943 [Vaccinium darrowii]
MAEDGLELEEGYFDPDFKVYAVRELNWSPLDISDKPDDFYADECPYEDDNYWRGIRWVFWSRQDYDYPERHLYHDNFVGSKSDACPSPEALCGYQEDLLRHVFDRFQEFGLQCIYGCKDCEMRDKDRDKDKDKNNALAVAFKELEMVVESVRDIHKLPLALTWVTCSTRDHLFQGQHLFQAVGDVAYWVFKPMLKICHLRRGQVTGRILTFPKLSYCLDVKQFSIAEYPLVTRVRLLELSGCFTMCLQSSLTGSELYALEFFLPPISKDDDNILTRLSLILRTVEENSQTFKLACSQEFGGGLSVEVIDFPNGQRSHSIQMIEDTRVFPTLVPLEDGGMLQLDQPDQPSMDAVNSRMNVVGEAQNFNLSSFEPLQNGKVATQLDSSDQSSMDPANNGQDVLTAKRNILEVPGSEERKRKTQKIEHSKIGVKIAVPLEDILKCSKMSRDDAARKLGVIVGVLAA